MLSAFALVLRLKEVIRTFDMSTGDTEQNMLFFLLLFLLFYLGYVQSCRRLCEPQRSGVKVSSWSKWQAIKRLQARYYWQHQSPNICFTSSAFSLVPCKTDCVLVCSELIMTQGLFILKHGTPMGMIKNHHLKFVMKRITLCWRRASEMTYNALGSPRASWSTLAVVNACDKTLVYRG